MLLNKGVFLSACIMIMGLVGNTHLTACCNNHFESHDFEKKMDVLTDKVWQLINIDDPLSMHVAVVDIQQEIFNSFGIEVELEEQIDVFVSYIKNTGGVEIKQSDIDLVKQIICCDLQETDLQKTDICISKGVFLSVFGTILGVLGGPDCKRWGYNMFDCGVALIESACAK